MASMYPPVIPDQETDPNNPSRVPLLNGESRMTPAPWQLPSGGASDIPTAFQNDFEQAQMFRDRAIASGQRTQQEADAVYIAPLKAKWGTIKSSPEILASPEKFMEFNTEFDRARDKFNSNVSRGTSAKESAALSLVPVLEKWSLSPTRRVGSEASPRVDKEFIAASQLATNPDANLVDVLGELGETLTPQRASAVRLLFEKSRKKTGSDRSLSTIENEARVWKDRAENENLPYQERVIAGRRLQQLKDESYKPYQSLAPTELKVFGKNMLAPSGQETNSAAKPSDADIEFLIANPNLKNKFEKRFGAGSANSYLK